MKRKTLSKKTTHPFDRKGKPNAKDYEQIFFKNHFPKKDKLKIPFPKK